MEINEPDCALPPLSQHGGSVQLCTQGWAKRLVASWCRRRLADTETAKLITRCRRAYRTGPLVDPVNRFADVLDRLRAHNAAEWRKLAEELEREAIAEDAADSPNPKLTDPAPRDSV